jgi:integrase
MALNLYRRHLRVAGKCTAGHEPDSRSYEPDELRRGWKKCYCPIYACGTLAGSFKRKNTERFKWDEAKSVASAWEAAGWWDGKFKLTPSVAAAAPALPAPGRMAIGDACAVFMSLREGEKIAAATLRKYRTFAKQLLAFAESRGYVMLDQLTQRDVDLFYGSLKLGGRAKAKRLGTLRAFFRFCVNREWLPKSPVSGDLRPPLGSSRVANKIPFTDAELERIIKACDALGEIRWSSGKGEGAWNGEDAKDFIWTLAYTGLRISDVALFNMTRLHGNEVFLRAKKNGGEVFAYIPDWLRDRLIHRSKSWGPMLFLVGKSERLETVTDTWRRKLNKVFELAGKFEERPTPHRFRHTFARILLQRGVPVADVADLLGDDEKTVREHYSRWVPERQARLTKILKDAFDDKPKPKLVALPGRRTLAT